MAISTIPTFKDKLYDALVADASIVAAKIQVFYGDPLPDPGFEFICLGDITDGQQDWVTFGGGGTGSGRSETYEMRLEILAMQQGVDQKSTTERAFTIAGYVEAVLRADPSVGGSVYWSSYGGTIRLEEFVSKDGGSRAALLTIGIQATARI